MNHNHLYRLLPDMNSLLESPMLSQAVEEFGRTAVKEAAGEVLEEIRRKIQMAAALPDGTLAGYSNEEGREDKSREDTGAHRELSEQRASAKAHLGLREQKAEEKADLFAEQIRAEIAHLPETILEKVSRGASPNMKRVINATGTILHTNLGRAPVSGGHLQKIAGMVSGYSNLEMNLETGKRGRRYDHFEQLLCELTGAEAALAVNNNAASVLLALSALCRGGETIVSRGELIEIGGKFRIPDVCEQSGTVLREVGTTNKTHPEDYVSAISGQTKAVLKVHTSNYRIVGFTESVGTEELARICHGSDGCSEAPAEERSIPLICDLGSGAFLDMEQFGLSHEPTVKEVISAGADLVCFSGDKLLGGPQAGLIVGRKKYIEILRKHPLNRALRIGKYTAAELELTLMEYHRQKAVENIPVLRMLNLKPAELKERAEDLLEKMKRVSTSMIGSTGDVSRKEAERDEVRQQGSAGDIAASHEFVWYPCPGVEAHAAAQPCMSAVGGGSLPTEELPGWAVTIHVDGALPADELAARLRASDPPIIGRIKDDRYWIDLRTVDPADYDLLAQAVCQALAL